MILVKIINIFFIASLLLFLPIIEPVERVDLTTNEIQEVTYNVHTTSVKIKVIESAPVTINVFKYDIDKEQLFQTHSNIIIEETGNIDFNDPGLYLFTLVSPIVNQVKLQGSGIFQSHVFIIITLLILNIGMYAFYFSKQRNEI